MFEISIGRAAGCADGRFVGSRVDRTEVGSWGLRLSGSGAHDGATPAGFAPGRPNNRHDWNILLPKSEKLLTRLASDVL
jgi:hypothetical protein